MLQQLCQAEAMNPDLNSDLPSRWQELPTQAITCCIPGCASARLWSWSRTCTQALIWDTGTLSSVTLHKGRPIVLCFDNNFPPLEGQLPVPVPSQFCRAFCYCYHVRECWGDILLSLGVPGGHSCASAFPNTQRPVPSTQARLQEGAAAGRGQDQMTW